MAIDINIGSKLDSKGFKQAETATQKLTKNLKTLAGAAGLAFGASAIVAYSKASVRAFAQDEAAAVRLNRAVENLGIGFANPGIADYIANLEKSASIADDILRPAFQGLLTTTGSLTASQKLLNDAITISRASGVDLATVTEDLGKGYVGITRGLAKYNTGLTRAELNTMSFSQILGVILTKSAGAAEDYLTTTAYKMDVLSIATGNASEKIGKGLVDALARAGGGTEASDAAVFLDTMADYLNKVTLAAGTAVGGLTNVFKTIKNLPKSLLGFAATPSGFGSPGASNKKPIPKLTLSEKKQQEALAKLESDAVKRNKELLALKKKQVTTQKQMTADKLKQEALDKAALVLAQGQKVFDEEGIQLAAAAQGKLTDEEKARLALKKDIYDLEAAINEGNLTAAAKLANSMVANAQKLAALRGDMIGLNDIQNPFTAWLATIQEMAMELAKLANIKPLAQSGFTPAQQERYDLLSESKAKIERKIQGDLEDRMKALADARARIENKISIDTIGTNANPASYGAGGSMSGSSVVVNVAGSVSTERDLVAAITQGLYAQQASGTPVTYSTVY